jgi:hypothetical protein
MPASLQLTRLLWTVLLLFWSAAAFAAQVTFAHDLRDIPPAAIGISVLLAIIGGAAYTAQKIADPATVVKSIAAEIVKDLLTSIVVGLCIFFLGSYFNWQSVVQAGLITLGGYSGSRILEPAVGGFVAWVSRMSGTTPGEGS